MNVTCPSCDAEFFVDTIEEVKYCVCCGDELDADEDADWEDEDEWDED